MKHDARTRARVLERARKGDTIASIVRRTGVSRNTIYRWLGEAGLERERRSGPLTKYPRAEIRALLKKNVSRAAICKRYGCSAKWLSNLANGHLKVKT